MKPMFTSIRFWLISSFSLILLTCLLAALLFNNAINQSNRLEDYHLKLKTLRIHLHEINKLKEDMLVIAFNEAGFYDKKLSDVELKFWALNRKIRRSIIFFKSSPITTAYSLSPRIDLLGQQLDEYNTTYNALIYLYKLKGFKNYGLEGKMRRHAHTLFDLGDRNVQFYCLMLRRHEKDFLLRKDLEYVQLFNSAVKDLVDYIQKNRQLSETERNHLIDEVYFYNKYFHSLARIESRIGVKGRDGFLNRSKASFDTIAQSIESLDSDLRQINDMHHAQLKRNTRIVVILVVIFLLTTIVILVLVITQSVRSISNAFVNYVNSSFNIASVSSRRYKIREFNHINISFLKMVNEIQIFTNFFKEKVHERTLEINKQKDEILEQQQKIESQYNVLLRKNSQLSKQKLMLANKNENIHDSLRYAKRIQRAIQPRLAGFRDHFSDSFIYYKPLHVVSGDFYLVYTTPASELSGEKITFVTADCTGHGVPGAMMSVLGINTINKLVNELKTTDPGLILKMLDNDINRVLAHGKKEDDIVSDGMDIAVFSLDKESMMLEYSIAKFSHYLLRDGQALSLHTQKSSIGYSHFESDYKNFGTSRFQLKPGDCLYLFSDGFSDQFGGPHNKKYKRSNIKALIETIGHLDMKAQKQIFRSEFKAWKGTQSQVDDVMVIGIRF